MVAATCIATTLEKRCPLPVDSFVPEPIFTSTHAITIEAPPEQVWPWIAQMGAGRAGWYSWDAIDNGGTLYVAMTLFVGLRWEGYSVASNVPSELSAIGAPTRTLWIRLGAVYGVVPAGTAMTSSTTDARQAARAR